MELNQLPKITTRKKKRLGRGYGSGKGGHTVGRGAKGTKARNKVALTFDGAKIKKSFLKRLPLQRGKGKFKSLKPKPIVVNLKYLNLLPQNSEVNLRTLVKQGLVKEKEARKYGVKILGDGELKVKLKVKLPCSQGARKKIEAAGGQVLAAVAKTAPPSPRGKRKSQSKKKEKK